MKTFSKEFQGWTLINDDRFLLSYIETYGNNLEEFIDNTMISLEDWHGNQGPDWDLNDLSKADYAAIVKMFRKALDTTLNQKGFNLIGLMIGMAIMSIMALGTAQLFNNMLLASQTADLKANVTYLTSTLAGIANNQETCTKAITIVPQKYGSDFQFNNLKTGTNLTDLKLSLKTFNYMNSNLVQTSPAGVKVYYGVITYTPKALVPVLGGFASRNVASIYVTTDPSGTITGCGPVMPVIDMTPLPIKTPTPVVTTPVPTADGTKGCSAIGGVYSNGICTLHSSKNDSDDDCDRK